MSMMEGTTIVAVRRDGKCAMAGDGQVTFGEKTIMKHGAVKVRRLYNGQVVVGFAGSVADAFTLSERFEAKLEQYGGSLSRAAVELAQEWRSDKMMRKLEAMLIAADKDEMLVVSGTGEVIDPDGGRRGHRFGRLLCPGRGPGAFGKHGSPGGRDCEKGHQDCLGYLHIHQWKHHAGGGLTHGNAADAQTNC